MIPDGPDYIVLGLTVTDGEIGKIKGDMIKWTISFNSLK